MAASPRVITISLLALKAVNEFLISHGHLLFISLYILPLSPTGHWGAQALAGHPKGMNFPQIQLQVPELGSDGKGHLPIDQMLRFRRTLCNHMDTDRDKYHMQFPPMNVKPGKGNLVTLNKSDSPGMDFLWLDLELSLASKTSLLSLLPKLDQQPNA